MPHLGGARAVARRARNSPFLVLHPCLSFAAASPCKTVLNVESEEAVSRKSQCGAIMYCIMGKAWGSWVPCGGDVGLDSLLVVRMFLCMCWPGGIPLRPGCYEVERRRSPEPARCLLQPIQIILVGGSVALVSERGALPVAAYPRKRWTALML